MNNLQSDRFISQSAEAIDLIETRMATYEQVLRGLKGLFVASESVTREEFLDYFQTLNLDENYPGMLGLAFSLCFPAVDLDAHIASMRAEGFPDYVIRPSGERDVYTSIIYIEPFAGVNLNAFGFDMYAEPVRRIAMDRAMVSGQAALSGKVALVQDVAREGVAGVLLYLPIYVEEFTEVMTDQKTLYGWVYAPFSMDVLMQGVQVDALEALELSIYDGERIDEEALLYTTITAPAKVARHELVARLTIAGQPWTVVLQSTAVFEANVSTLLPALIAGIGIAISGLLTLLVWSLSSGRHRALAAAERITAELRGTEFRWKSALAGAGDGVWDWNNLTDEVVFSGRWKSMLQYRDDEIHNHLSEWERLLHPEDHLRVMRAIQDCLDGTTDSLSHEIRLRDASGQWRWILTRGAVVSRDENGKALRTIGTHTDISAQKAVELALLESDRRFRGAFETAAIGMALVSLEGRWLQVNRALVQMLGYSEDELLQSNFQDITHPDDLNLDLEQLQKLNANSIDHYHMEKRYRRKDGEIIYVLLSVSLVRDLNGEPVHYVSQIENITERRELQQLVEHQATHDELTGLPNRRLLHDRLVQAMAQCRRYHRHMAVMFVDIDHFKSINDNYGHDVGDEVLCEVVARLRRCIRLSDTFARQGGDEFVVLLTEIQSAMDIERVADVMISTLHAPLLLRRVEVQVTLSIGVAVFDPDSADSDESLLRKADEALYAVKRGGRNGFCILD
ncbi:MAG: CHASE domain-containing protein [Gammaproteobacteria bacterium]|nr:CHASE domain-containing protein [Gammaproteobacteria bacterium]